MLDVRSRFTASDNIVDDVGLDSLEMMEFMLEVEQRFELELDLEQMEFDVFESIERFAGFLRQLKDQQRPGATG